MKKITFIILLCIVHKTIFAQISYDEILSSQLNTTRQLKIKLPKDYDEYSEVRYPLIIVFDGDYLFEPIAGQVDFQTYFDDMPSSIIVGIVQGNERRYDGYCDEVTGLPKESGIRFHNFVATELIPYLDNKYNTSEFTVAVGHDLMGNFINSYLFKENPLFNAYVCISPDLSGTVRDYLAQRLEMNSGEIFYYMATSDKDLPYIREAVLNVNAKISEVNNQNLTYYFDEFKNETHYTLVTSAIARSFDKIFELYKPLREKELEEKVLPYEHSLDKYLIERYERIEDLFGIKKPIPEEEFEKMAKIADERGDVESYKGLASLAKKEDPNAMLGLYYSGVYAAKNDNKTRALKYFEEALQLNEGEIITADLIVEKMENLAAMVAEEEAKVEEEKAQKRAEKEAEKEAKRIEKEQEKAEKEKERIEKEAEKQKAKEAKEEKEETENEND